jgi:hypothetical protein
MQYQNDKMKISLSLQKDYLLFCIMLSLTYRDKAMQSGLNESIALHIEVGRLKFYCGKKYKPQNENIKTV